MSTYLSELTPQEKASLEAALAEATSLVTFEPRTPQERLRWALYELTTLGLQPCQAAKQQPNHDEGGLGHTPKCAL